MKSVATALVLATVIALTISSSTAQASIMVGTAAGFGVDSLTIDTDTGLEWLDWTESTGISYNDMITQFQVGGDYEGWRHATRDEVQVLFGNLGLNTGNWPASTTTFDGGASASAAIAYLGSTSGSTMFDFANGLTSTSFPGQSADQYIAGIASFFGDRSVNAALAGQLSSESSNGVGHALVRVTGAVPEPTSLLCWLGLATVGITRRRRNQ